MTLGHLASTTDTRTLRKCNQAFSETIRSVKIRLRGMGLKVCILDRRSVALFLIQLLQRGTGGFAHG